MEPRWSCTYSHRPHRQRLELKLFWILQVRGPCDRPSTWQESNEELWQENQIHYLTSQSDENVTSIRLPIFIWLRTHHEGPTPQSLFWVLVQQDKPGLSVTGTLGTASASTVCWLQPCEPLPQNPQGSREQRGPSQHQPLTYKKESEQCVGPTSNTFPKQRDGFVLLLHARVAKEVFS